MNEKQVKLDELMPFITEQLNEGKSVTFSPRGTSMLPLLKEGRDSVTLSKPVGRLKKYDIPLYRRKNGQYVLHRIVKVSDTYTCIGDNQFLVEPGIEDVQIIAVCTAFKRKGREYSAYALKWRLYAFFWHHSRFLRRVFSAVLRRTKRIFKKN